MSLITLSRFVFHVVLLIVVITKAQAQVSSECQCPLGNITGANLVINGNFDQGNVGFSSDYTFQPFCSPGMYNVSSSLNLVNMCNDWGCLDHTSSDVNGNVLVADGMQVPGPAVWRQMINLEPNKNYKFCAFANNLNLPQLDRGDPIVEAYLISANGTITLLSSKSLSESPDEWVSISSDINTGTSVDNPYRLEFKTAGNTFEGNNFALDDIQLFECIKPLLNCSFLCNSDFEDQQLVAPNKIGYFFEGTISCWKTTSIDRLIEMWGDGYKGVPAFSGKQFIELNGNFVSTLYQEFTPSAGAEVEISFAHRGRQGVDELSLEIGPVGGPYVNLGNFKADNTKWNYNTISFQFPVNATGRYSLRFRSVSSSSGSTSGNFLDAISLKIKAPRIVSSIKNPSCQNAINGFIRIDSIFGAKPFQYKWSSDPNVKDSISNLLSSGKYNLTITDFYGCQHEYKFELNNSFGDSTYINAQSCEVYNWPVSGLIYNNSGRYQHKLRNQWQCDSIIFLDLQINKNDTVLLKQESCKSYFWPANKSNLTQSGLYTHTLSNSNLCDSTIILDLTIYKSDTSQIEDSRCDTFIWNVNNSIYTSSGKFYHTLQSIHSCDSVIELNLYIRSSYKFKDDVSTCKDFLWNVNNTKYDKDGIYFYNLIASNGCDSTHILDLTIHPIDTEKINKKACTEYFWPLSNQNYSQSGTYYSTLKNRFACDSVVQLQLEISESKLTNINEESCVAYVFPYNQQRYTQSGQYVFKQSSSEGCDSVIILNLTIHPESMIKIQEESCDEYYWPITGETYLSSGTYTYNLKSQFGCDSIFQLNLKIDSGNIYIDSITTFDTYRWPINNIQYEKDGIYELKFLNSTGCDSNFILVLKIIKEGEIFIPNSFSPNDDGINDFFTAYSSEEIDIIDRMIIYDRWGNLVFEKNKFEANNNSLGWNGTYRGQKLNPAVFTVIVEFTNLRGIKKTIRGDLTLIK